MAAIRRRVLSLAATGCIPDEAVRKTLVSRTASGRLPGVMTQTHHPVPCEGGRVRRVNRRAKSSPFSGARVRFSVSRGHSCPVRGQRVLAAPHQGALAAVGPRMNAATASRSSSSIRGIGTRPRLAAQTIRASRATRIDDVPLCRSGRHAAGHAEIVPARRAESAEAVRLPRHDSLAPFREAFVSRWTMRRSQRGVRVQERRPVRGLMSPRRLPRRTPVRIRSAPLRLWMRTGRSRTYSSPLGASSRSRLAHVLISADAVP